MKKAIISLGKDILKSSIVALLISIIFSLVCNILLIGIFHLESDLNFDPIMICLNLITYFYFFYSFRERKRYEFFSTNEEFHWWNEVKSYFSAEGKYLLIFYCVMAVLCEINYFITPNTPQKPVVFVCSMFFPFFTILRIPFVRSILSIMIAMVLHTALVEIRSYKTKKKSQ